MKWCKDICKNTCIFLLWILLTVSYSTNTAFAVSDDCLTLLGTFISDHSRIESAHSSITHDLFRGNVVSADRFYRNRNRNVVYKIKIFNPKNNHTRYALFKPRTVGDVDGWNRTPMEYVAYQLNQMLGLDYVAPVAYRKNLNIDGHTEGAFIYFVPNAHGLKRVSLENWGQDKVFTEIDKQLFLSDTRILDVLLLNPDRHIDNFMRGKHWVDGKYRPMLIDHSSSLRTGTTTNMLGDGHDAFNVGAPKVVRKITWLNLHSLNFEKLHQLFDEFMSEDEIQQLLKRRDEIIRYFNQLIEEHGYDSVVRDL